MTIKEVIEQSAQATRCEIALAQIEQATAIRNDRLSEAFAQRHSDCWREYTTLHRETILADYVAELQTPQFQPWGTDGAYVTHQGKRALSVIHGTESEAMRLASTVAQLLNESGAVL